MAETYVFKEVTESQFRKLLKKGGWLLLDLYGSGCPDCTSLQARAEITKKYKDYASLVRMDVANAGGVVEEFQLITIPTLILFEDGKRRSQFVGVPGDAGENVLEWLEQEFKVNVPAPTKLSVAGAAGTV